jgi:hypothetical protein
MALALTLDLPEDAEQRLEHEASRRGLSTADYVACLVQVSPTIDAGGAWLETKDPGPEFRDFDEVLNLLSELPDPQRVLALKASPELSERMETLLERNRESGLSAEEQREWERYDLLNHVVTLAKINAQAKLQSRGQKSA